MKKIILSLAVLSVLVACEKKNQETDLLETVDVSIAANQSYEYNLGIVKMSDIEISGAEHASGSNVISKTGSTNAVYRYMPDSSFIGTDKVTIVLNQDECKKEKSQGNGSCQNQNSPPPPKKQNCKKGNKDENRGAKKTIVLNITVGNSVASDK